MHLGSDHLTLTSSRHLRILTLFSLYLAQGIPFGLSMITFPAYFAAQNVPLLEISQYMALINFPLIGKPIYALIVERYKLPKMGMNRPWIIGAMGMIIILMTSLALWNDEPPSIRALTYLMFTINMFAAIQDVAVDGMAINVLPDDERATASSFMWGGMIIGYSGFGAFGSYLLHSYGVFSIGLAGGLVGFAILCLVLCFRERENERLHPWSDGGTHPLNTSKLLQSWPLLFKKFKTQLFLPVTLIIFLFAILNGTVRGFIGPVSVTYFIQELGWSDINYSEWYGTSYMMAGGLVMAAGLWMSRLKSIRPLFTISCLALAILGTAFWVFTECFQTSSSQSAFIFIRLIFSTMMGATFLAIAMDCCTPDISTTQLAIIMGFSSLGDVIGNALPGLVADWVTKPGMFGVYSILTLCPVLVLYVMTRMKAFHRQSS